jgi:hypothetical protein
MLTRRTFLFLLLALLSLDFGFSRYQMNRETPAGWKTERWQAGFGSWCCGGYLVAYDISIPEDYDLTQKCGKAWVVNDDAMIYGFLVEFSFFGTSSSEYADKDFGDYMKTGAAYSAESLGRRASEIALDSATSYDVGAMRFSRSDIMLGTVQASAQEGKRPDVSTARGFRLIGSGMSIISELNLPRIDEVNEKIIRSMRPVRGYSLFDLMAGSVPFLSGC